MIFALIGGVLPGSVKENVNGVVVSSRDEYNILQIWFKNYNTTAVADLEQCIRDLLQVPDEVTLVTKPFVRCAKDFASKASGDIIKKSSSKGPSNYTGKRDKGNK